MEGPVGLEVVLGPDALHFVFVVVPAEQVQLVFLVDRGAGVVVHFGARRGHDLL